MASTRTVSIYMLKPTIGTHRAALKEGVGDLHEHVVDADETQGTLFVQDGEPGLPDWVRFLDRVTEPELTYRTRSLRGVLVLEAVDRLFAVTFGNARHLLDPDGYERDFGLLCALNGVNPERLRGAEARTFDDYALHTLRQLSRLSSLESLELNTDRELVVSLAGQLDDEELGKKVDGRDAVRLTAELEPEELRAKCTELRRLSQRKHYQDNFPFFDTIKRVRDPEEIVRLEGKAFSALGKREFKGFDLFPPQIVSDEIVVFRIAPATKGLTTVAEPDSSLLRYPLRVPRSPADAEAELRRFKLRGIDANGEIVDEWTFFKCLHWEIADGGSIYVLDAGQWYRIEPSLVADVEAFAKDLDASGIEWPPAAVGQREDAYNEQAASLPGMALLDKHCVRLPGQSEIEVCDIFSKQRHFVHVKHRKGGSGPLSHLFAQALVSAEGFVMEPEFRRLFREELEIAHPGFGRFSPQKVDPHEYRVVLALITTPTAKGKVAEKLPFFSKVMLRLAVKRLQSMGFEVFIDAIPTQLGLTGLPVAPVKGRRKTRAAVPSAKGRRKKPAGAGGS
jgi:uncharacterized protein (TIGR04141 family)